MLAIEERLHGVAPGDLHRDRIRKSLAGIRRQTTAQPLDDLGRIAAEVDITAQLTRENRSAIALSEGGLRTQRKCDDRRERETIDRGVLLFAEQLLRRGEGRRSARTGALLAGGLRDTEVGDPPASIAIDENVLRFEIAMDDPNRACRGRPEQEAPAARSRSSGAPRRATSSASDPPSVLHRTTTRRAAVPIEDRHDGRMSQLHREPRLAPKASHDPLVARHARVQQLERHLAAQ
jgi:hypothetical protein